MRDRIHMVILAVAATALQLATTAAMPASESETAAKKERPSKVESIDGSKVKRVTVTEKAAQRLDIQTGLVASDGAGQLSAPYASIVYDISGGTWVYTVPKPLTYVRQSVVVQSIKGDKALLKEGPAPGVAIVTVGVAELYGTEKGIGK